MNDYDVGKIFQEIELHLIKSMKRNLLGHELEEMTEGFKWEQWQAKKLRELKKFRKQNRAIFQGYKNQINMATRIDLVRQFLEGGRKVDKEVKEAIKKGYLIKKTPSDDFFNAENKKLEAMIKAINNDMQQAQTAALRMMDDVYRATIYKSQVFTAAGATTVSQAVDMAVKDFLTKGITCITYKDGRNVGIDSWARMSIRTANKKAFLMGEGERRKEWGESLVLVSQYLQCSPLCIHWQGKVYIDDVYSGGKKGDGDYPLLSMAIGSRDNQLFHPNCRHTMSTFFLGINEKPEPMAREQVEGAYEKAQKEAYIERNLRKYQRLKEGSTDKTNIEKYRTKEKEWKNRLRLLKNPGSDKINTSKYNMKLKWAKQPEHVIGTKQWKNRVIKAYNEGQSLPGAFYSKVDIDKLIKKYSGSGIPVTKNLYPKEFVDTDEIIGITYDFKARKYIKTSRICIQYSSKGVHAYPVIDNGGS